MRGFGNATFKRDTQFVGATFKGNAGFISATFQDPAAFWQVTFKDVARFSSATFSGNTSFSKTKFDSGAEFEAIKAERAFTLEKADFTKVPNFIQANFTEAPRLDNADFHWVPDKKAPADETSPATSVAKKKRDEQKPDPDLSARYRALKRLAVQGHDTDRELEFNAGEIKSRRHVRDFPFGENAGRYWFGWLYEKFSDFGRSVTRPILLWSFFVLFFAALYSSPWSGRGSWSVACEQVVDRYQKPESPPVLTTLNTNALWEALSHSFRNATLVLSVAQPAAEWRTLGCLYGNSKDSPSFAPCPASPQPSALCSASLALSSSSCSPWRCKTCSK